MKNRLLLSMLSVVIHLAVTSGCKSDLNDVAKSKNEYVVQATLASCDDYCLSKTPDDRCMATCKIVSNISMPIVLGQEVKESRSDCIATRVQLEPPGILNGRKESLKIVYTPIDLDFGMKIVAVENDSIILSVFGEVLDQKDEQFFQSDRNSFKPGVKRVLRCSRSINLNESSPVVVAQTDLQQKEGQIIMVLQLKHLKSKMIQNGLAPETE